MPAPDQATNSSLISWPTGPQRCWPGKILLAGEYSVTHHPFAFTIPLHAWAGKWHKCPALATDAWLKFGQWITQQAWPWLDHERCAAEFATDHLASDLPQGQGLGSSGALCAAIYDRYQLDAQPLAANILVKRLAALEGYFHGVSSGFDPLVSLVERPCALQHGHLEILPAAACWQLGEHPGPTADPYVIFLWQSPWPRHAAGLMDFYQQAVRTVATWVAPLAAAQANLAESLTKLFRADLASSPAGAKWWAAVAQNWQAVSQYQQTYLAPMIGPALVAPWSGPDYALKLCGKGGGGMYLGLAQATADLAYFQQQGKLWFLQRPTSAQTV